MKNYLKSLRKNNSNKTTWSAKLFHAWMSYSHSHHQLSCQVSILFKFLSPHLRWISCLQKLIVWSQSNFTHLQIFLLFSKQKSLKLLLLSLFTKKRKSPKQKLRHLETRKSFITHDDKQKKASPERKQSC